MKARVGDEIVIRGHRPGEQQRRGEVVEVRGEDGAPPYVVRWRRDGHEALLVPGLDATVDRHDGP